MADDFNLAGGPEDETLPLAAEGEDPIAAAKREAKEELAREIGWTPREDWVGRGGDPDKWKPAEQYVRDGRDIQQSSNRELKGVREQLDRIAGVTSQIIEDKVAERDAYWNAQLDKAVDEGDHELKARAVKEIAKAQPARNQGPPPETAAWIEKNPWFNTDPLAQMRAEEVAARLAAQGHPVATQLREAERAIRREFSEHFPKAKDPPGVQTAQSRKAAPSNRAKGFADMPPESQRAAMDFERLNNVPKDDFARQYWANEAKRGSRA